MKDILGVLIITIIQKIFTIFYWGMLLLVMLSCLMLTTLLGSILINLFKISILSFVAFSVFLTSFTILVISFQDTIYTIWQNNKKNLMIPLFLIVLLFVVQNYRWIEIGSHDSLDRIKLDKLTNKFWLSSSYLKIGEKVYVSDDGIPVNNSGWQYEPLFKNLIKYSHYSDEKLYIWNPDNYAYEDETDDLPSNLKVLFKEEVWVNDGDGYDSPPHEVVKINYRLKDQPLEKARLTFNIKMLIDIILFTLSITTILWIFWAIIELLGWSYLF